MDFRFNGIDTYARSIAFLTVAGLLLFGFLFLQLIDKVIRGKHYNRWQNNLVEAAGTSAAQTAFMCVLLGAFDILRDQTGGKFGYRYATLDEIQRHIRPYLQAENLSYSFDVELDGKVLMVWCVVRHVDGHSERNKFPVPIETDSRMSDAQANGAALTYGKRQALSAGMGLTIEEDTDAARQETVQYITDEQAANLSDLCDQAGPRAKGLLLSWLGVPSIAEIVAADFQKAADALNAKIQKRA